MQRELPLAGGFWMRLEVGGQHCGEEPKIPFQLRCPWPSLQPEILTFHHLALQTKFLLVLWSSFGDGIKGKTKRTPGWASLNSNILPDLLSGTFVNFPVLAKGASPPRRNPPVAPEGTLWFTVQGPPRCHWIFPWVNTLHFPVQHCFPWGRGFRLPCKLISGQ